MSQNKKEYKVIPVIFKIKGSTLETQPCLFLIKSGQENIGTSHLFPWSFLLLPEEPSFQTHRVPGNRRYCQSNSAPSQTCFLPWPSKTGNLHSYQFCQEKIPLLSEASFVLEPINTQSSVPTHRKTTLGLELKRREEKQEGYVMFCAAENALKLADGKWGWKRWEASKIKKEIAKLNK